MKRLAKNVLACIIVFSVLLMCILPVNAESYFQSKGFQFLLTENDSAVICGYTGTSENIVIPQTLGGYKVEKIADYAFSNKDFIKSVDLSQANSLVSIGASSFAGCINLEAIDFPESLSSMGRSCFQGCTSLLSVELGKKIVSIPTQAFYNCTALTTVTIPETVEAIGSNAFGGCTSLISALILSEAVSINQSSFNNCPFLIIYGYINTSAEKIAELNGMRFFNIDESQMYDVNGDGQVNVDDVTHLQMYLADLVSYDIRLSVVARKLDIDSDKEINVRDVTHLQKFLVGLV